MKSMELEETGGAWKVKKTRLYQYREKIIQYFVVNKKAEVESYLIPAISI